MRGIASGLIGLFILYGTLIFFLFLFVNLFTDTSGRWIFSWSFSWSWGGFFKVVVLLITGLFAIFQIVFTTIVLFEPKSSTHTLSHWIIHLCLFIVPPIGIFILSLRWLVG